MTFHERQPKKLKLVRSYPNSKLRLMGPSHMLSKLEMMTTFHERRPPIEEDLKKTKIKISQQPLIRSYPNSKLSGQSQILWEIKMKTTSHGRQPNK
jgi:hypothetical protein